MIRCKVTLAGVVNKAATTHQGKDGKPFVSFGVSLPLGDNNGSVKEYEVSVSAGNDIIVGGLISVGKRVSIVGTLYFRKKNDVLYLNMYADSITMDVGETDKLEGEMEFKGRTGKKDIRTLKDKRGKEFQSFSAYSKESSGEEAMFIWVHFLNFDPSKSPWLAPSTSINVKGTLDLKLYNGNIDLGCMVSEISQWEYKGPQETVQNA